MHAHTRTPRVHTLLLIYQTNTRRVRVSTILARLSITRPQIEQEVILAAYSRKARFSRLRAHTTTPRIDAKGKRSLRQATSSQADDYPATRHQVRNHITLSSTKQVDKHNDKDVQVQPKQGHQQATSIVQATELYINKREASHK